MELKKFIVQQTDVKDLGILMGIAETNTSPKDASYWSQSKSRILSGELIALTALDADKQEPVGYGFLNWQPKYRVYQQQNIPEIQDLNVIPEYRRQGVARAMITACEELARAKDCTQIGISYGLTREFGPAQVLYHSLGFMPDGFGVTYDREAVTSGQVRAIDDDLCLMLVKRLED